jgi:WD40 repeat protein
MDVGGESPAESASAFVVAIEDYEHHLKLDNLSELASDFVKALEYGGFIDALPSGRNGGKAQELMNQVKSWFTSADSQQCLLLFWSSHGERESSNFYLMTEDSPTYGFDQTNSVDPKFIAMAAARSKARRILLIIDACHSGVTIGTLISEIGKVLSEWSPDVVGRRGIAVVASAHANQKPQAGVVCRLLKEALMDASCLRRWSDSDRFIDGDRLMATLKDEFTRRGIDQRIVTATYDETIELIPNPRYRSDLPGENVEERLWRLARSDGVKHFELAARGIEVGEKGWFFCGRKRLLRELVDWLTTAKHGVRIVTGPPGAGKSAVIGRLATLSDPDCRREAIEAGAVMEEDDAIPSAGTIDVAVHAKGKSLNECARALAEGLGIPVALQVSVDIDRLVMDLSKHARKITVVIDALDEATEAAAIASRLIVPFGRLPHVCVLVGSRRSLDGKVAPHAEDRHGRLHEAFGIDAVIDDLEDEKDTREDIADYVQLRLQSSEKHRRDAPEVIAAAGRVADQANGVFLYARIVSRTLQEQDKLDRDLPSTALDAFEQDLSFRFKGAERRVADLLRALAWGEGKGLTRRVWPLVANVIAGAGRPYDDDDVAWVLGHAGWHIIEAGEDGQTVYRLSHQALTDHYHDKVDEKATQCGIVSALRQGIKSANWLNCDKYLWRHLAAHALKAGTLGELVKEGMFLAVADPLRLLQALSVSRDPLVWRAYACYSLAFDWLRDQPPDVRLCYLGMMARQQQDNELADIWERDGARRRWRVPWARFIPVTHRKMPMSTPVFSVALCTLDHRPVIVSGGTPMVSVCDLATGALRSEPLRGHDGAVLSVAAVTIDGQQVVVSGGSDGTVRVWDLASGTQRYGPLRGHRGKVRSVTLGMLDGRAVVVSGSDDRTVRVWDLASGTQCGEPLRSHERPVTSVAFGTIDGRPVIVSGVDHETMRIWELASGYPRGDQRRGYQRWVTTLTLGTIDEKPVIVSGGDDGTVRVWDLASNRQRGQPLRGHAGRVNSVAFGTIDGRPIAVSGGHDRTVRVWDLASGEQRGEPLRGHEGRVTTVSLGTIDGPPVIVSGGFDNTVRVWDLASGALRGEPRRSVGQIKSIALGTTRRSFLRAIATFSVEDVAARNRPAIISSDSEGIVQVWDLALGKQHGKPLLCREGDVDPFALGAIDGRTVIVSIEDLEKVRVWRRRLWYWQVLSQHRSWISYLLGWINYLRVRSRKYRRASSEKGRLTRSRFLRIWWSKHRRLKWGIWPRGELVRGHLSRVNSVVLGTDEGRPIIVLGESDGTVCVWDLTSGMQRGEPMRGHKGWVASVALGTIGGRPTIASGGYDGTVRLWDLASGEQRGKVRCGNEPVISVALGTIDDQLVVVSGGDDQTVRVWDEDGTAVSSVRIGSSVRALAFAGPGSVVVAADRGLLLLQLEAIERSDEGGHSPN